MGIQILREHTEMPWANGGGTTFEVARFPQSGDFDWRVSLAEVKEDSPFSVLPEIDRTLILLEGVSITLTSADQVIELKELEPYSFPGETLFNCRLSTGKARDLNIMSRRSKYSSTTKLIGPGAHKIDGSINTHILICITGQLQINNEKLNSRDGAKVTENVEVNSTGTFAHIEFTEH
jgi:environmental stress-induced protein Ves